jgi:hypothetical protein
MLMNRLIFWGILVMAGHSLAAQSIVSGQFLSDELIHSTMGKLKSIPEYEGSPYLNDSFSDGKVYLKDKTMFKLKIRYNLFDDVLEVKHKGRDMQILPADLIELIEFDSHRLTVGEFEVDNKMNRSFLFVLDTGEVDLLMRKTVKFEEWRPAKAQETAPKPATFKPSLDYYYIKSPNGKIHAITKIKDLPSLFPRNRKKVESFIESNKTKLKAEKLVALFQSYNTNKI